VGIGGSSPDADRVQVGGGWLILIAYTSASMLACHTLSGSNRYQGCDKTGNYHQVSPNLK